MDDSIPIRIDGLNAKRRMHWRVQARQAREHRLSTYGHLLASGRPRPALPCVVTITRIAPRLLDADNAIGGCKSCRDGVADWLGIDDRDPRVEWRYRQERGSARQYGVRVEFG